MPTKAKAKWNWTSAGWVPDVRLSRVAAGDLLEEAGLEAASPQAQAACCHAIAEVLANHRAIERTEAERPRAPEVSAALREIATLADRLQSRLVALDDETENALEHPKRRQAITVVKGAVVPEGPLEWWSPDAVIRDTIAALRRLELVVSLTQAEVDQAPSARRRAKRTWMFTVTQLAAVFDRHAGREALAGPYDAARVAFIRRACQAARIKIPPSPSRWPELG